MRTIIAGSRDITNYGAVEAAYITCPWEVTQIVSGGARGVDTLGEQLAEVLDIPLVVFPAEWDKYGKAAGSIRNEVMAKNADALIAIWDGRSTGTKNMIKIAKHLGLKIYIPEYASNN